MFLHIPMRWGFASVPSKRLIVKVKLTFKPISCHLYPVRLQKYDGFTAVNYHRWGICDCARTLGGGLNVPVYRFLKEPLVRRFGTEWYDQLDIAAGELEKQQ